MPAKLALFGGGKTRPNPFPPHPVIDSRERQAVLDVVDSNCFSTFVASPGTHFLGGKRIREFERVFAEYHGMKHAISVNSATAGLHCAIAALGCGPGDEVIVPPYTFTSTASAAIMHNAIPVFADIEDTYFCIDPAAIERAVTPQTKAVIAVHLFGHPAEMDTILAIARKHSLPVIEDCAQSPGALYKGRLAGTMGDLSVYSFQESKTLMTGEGGMVLTNDDELAERCQMIRNHGEVVVSGKPRSYIASLVGWNYRMTELEAAIGIVQLDKLADATDCRIRLCNYLTERLAKFPGLTVPHVRDDCKHVYFVYSMKFDAAAAGFPRNALTDALLAEGVPVGAGYVPPLYLNPIYQERIGYGTKGCPFTCPYYEGSVSYEKGICPVTERMHEQELLLIPVCRPPAAEADMQDIVDAFEKIYANAAELNANWKPKQA